MAIIKGSVEITKKEYDTSVAQQTADDAKQETIEINKTLTEVDKRVSDAQSKADESLEKAQEGFDKAEALSEKVDVNTGAISSIKQTTEGLQTEVKSKADSSTVTQLADVVASKVSNADFESNKTQTAELISSTVKQSVNLNGNLLSDAAFKGTLWGISSGSSSIVVDKTNTHGDANSFKITGGTTGGFPAIIHPFFSEKSFELIGKKVALSAYLYVSSTVKPSNEIYFELCGYPTDNAGASNVNVLRCSIKPTEIVYDRWVRYEATGVVPKTTSLGANNFYRVLLRVNNNTPVKSVVYYAKPQLEISDYATAWKTSESDSTSQSQISQLADNINLKVDAGDVINQINIDPKGVIISGKKISLDGDVRVLPGFKLTAETINGGTFNGNSFIKAIDIKTNDGNLPVEIKGKSSIDDAGIIIEQKTKDITSGGIISDSRSILNNGLTVGTALDAANGDRRIDYTKDYSQVSASGVITPNLVRSSDRAVPYWNGTASGDFSKATLKANGITPTATNFYIGVQGEARIVDEKGNVSGQSLTYKPIRASAFTVASSRDYKKTLKIIQEMR